MKFSTRTLLIALLSIAAFVIPANAQREKALGIGGGYASHNNGGYANVYFQCEVVPHVRIAPEIGYIFANKGESGFEMSVDAQFPFRIVRGFGVYPLAGITFNNWSPKHGDNYSRVGADFGAGFDIYMTSNLKLTLQGKYSLMNDCSGCFLEMGIAYLF